jgi:Flp pilus assembly protein TadB
MSENFEKYKGTINRIYRETKDEQWTMPLATLVLLLGGILLITILVNVVFFSFPNLFVAFLVYLIEILAPLFVLYRHQQKVYNAVREKVAALETAEPGIMNAFEEWHARVAPKES